MHVPCQCAFLQKIRRLAKLARSEHAIFVAQKRRLMGPIVHPARRMEVFLSPEADSPRTGLDDHRSPWEKLSLQAVNRQQSQHQEKDAEGKEDEKQHFGDGRRP